MVFLIALITQSSSVDWKVKMKFVWFFVVVLLVDFVAADDAPGFFLKTTKNIPRVKFLNFYKIELFKYQIC
jgi:hypothetical protein